MRGPETVMKTRIRATALSVLTLAAGLLLCVAAGAVASTVAPLPASDYYVRHACGPATPGYAHCLALELVPTTAASRAHTHPLAITRSSPVRAVKAPKACTA